MVHSQASLAQIQHDRLIALTFSYSQNFAFSQFKLSKQKWNKKSNQNALQLVNNLHFKTQ